MALLKAFPAASSALRKPLVSTALRSSFAFRPSLSAAKHTQFLTSNKFSTAAAPVSRFSYSPGAGASEATPLSRSSSSTSASPASFQSSSNSNAFPSSAAAIAAGAAPATRREADTGVGSQIPLATGPVEGTVPVSINGSTTSRPSVDFKGDWVLPHPLWNGEYVWNVDYTHYPPKDFVDRLAKWTIKTIRFNFDWMSGYSFGKLTPAKALLRVVFLETVAGVPGSVGGVLRHLASLRRMKRDGGWIHTLIEEAENERMHLLTFIKLRQPGPFLRLCVFLTQGVFFNFFWISYLISPRFCHRLVGYLEEEAVLTYTKMLHEIDNGSLSEWKDMPAPDIAKKYWALPENATIRDVVAHVRADEAHHRDVNHRFASLKSDELNPFAPGH